VCCAVLQPSPDLNRDFVFNEGPRGLPGQKGQKGDGGLPGDPAPRRADLPSGGRPKCTVALCWQCKRLSKTVHITHLISSHLITSELS